MEVYLDGRALDSREALHQALSALLAFPAYYGKNLDALHDCLTDLSDPVHLTVLHAQALEDALGAYCRSFQRVLSDSAQENEHHPHLGGISMPRTRKRAGPGHFYSFMAHNCRASFHLAQAVHNCGCLRAGKLSFGQKRAVRALQNTLSRAERDTV